MVKTKVKEKNGNDDDKPGKQENEDVEGGWE